MPEAAVIDVAYVTTVLCPENTPNPHPRQYFYIGAQLSDRQLVELEKMLTKICKHISSVGACFRTPKGVPAHMYVTYGGLDSHAPSTEGRIAKYYDDVLKAITDYFAA